MGSELTDTLARACAALLDLEPASVQRIMVDYKDGDQFCSLLAWRCQPCSETHIQIDTSSRWNRETADSETFDHNRPHGM